MGVCVVACGCSGGLGTVQWFVQFGEGVPEPDAAVVRVQIRAGSCDGPVLYDAVLADGQVPAMPSNLAPGVHAFSAFAINASCEVFARGCEVVALSEATTVSVQVTLTMAFTPAACPPSHCDAGLCDGISDDWLEPSFSRRRFIVVDGSAISPDAGPVETFSGFPALVRLNGSRIDYARATGRDIRFYGSEGTPMSYEIERWDPEGESVAWVRLDNITAGSSQQYFWMYYGDPVADSAATPSAVWAPDYVAVFHMAETAPGSVLDSTMFDTDGEPAEGVTSGGFDRGIIERAVESPVGRGYRFVNGQAVELSQHAARAPLHEGSWSFWLRRDWSDEGDEDYTIGGFATDTTGEISFNWQGRDTSDDHFYARFPGPSTLNEPARGVVPEGQWKHIALGWLRNDELAVFVDGERQGVRPMNGLGAAASAWCLGAVSYCDSSAFRDISMPAAIDEVRFSSVRRSEWWVFADHLSMTDRLLTFGLEETR